MEAYAAIVCWASGQCEGPMTVSKGVAVRPGGFGQRWRDYLYSDTELHHF